MTLIELLETYRDNTRLYGRKWSDSWLERVMVNHDIIPDIKNTVNDDGQYIDGFGNPFDFFRIDE